MDDRERIAQAMREGSEAGRSGVHPRECPYDPRSTDRLERVCVTLWLRMHARHDPPPVDFTG